MAFEALLNKPMIEQKLLELLVAETRKAYDIHQNTYFFFKLKHVSERMSEVIWIKSFSDENEFADFYYDTKVMRAAIMLKFCKGRYEVLCQGFFYSDRFEVWPDKILNNRPMERPYKKSEKTPMPPRELIERAFGEIAAEIALPGGKIPMC